MEKNETSTVVDEVVDPAWYVNGEVEGLPELAGGLRLRQNSNIEARRVLAKLDRNHRSVWNIARHSVLHSKRTLTLIPVYL